MSSSSRPTSSDTPMGASVPTGLSQAQSLENERNYLSSLATMASSCRPRTTTATVVPPNVVVPSAPAHVLPASSLDADVGRRSRKGVDVESRKKCPAPKKSRPSVDVPGSSSLSVRGTSRNRVDVSTLGDSTHSLRASTDGRYQKLRSHPRRVPHEAFSVTGEYKNYPFVEPSMYGASLVNYEVVEPLNGSDYLDLSYQKGGEMFEYFQLSIDSARVELEEAELEVARLRKEKRERPGRGGLTAADKLVVVELERDNLKLKVTQLEACLAEQMAKASGYASDVTRLTQQVNEMEVNNQRLVRSVQEWESTSTGTGNPYEVVAKRIFDVRQEGADRLAAVVERFRQRGLSEHPDLDWESLSRVSPEH